MMWMPMVQVSQEVHVHMASHGGIPILDIGGLSTLDIGGGQIRFADEEEALQEIAYLRYLYTGACKPRRARSRLYRRL